MGTYRNRNHYLIQTHMWVESKCNFEDLKTTTVLGLGWNPVAQCMVSMILSPAQPLHIHVRHMKMTFLTIISTLPTLPSQTSGFPNHDDF